MCLKFLQVAVFSNLFIGQRYVESLCELLFQVHAEEQTSSRVNLIFSNYTQKMPPIE